MVVVLEIGWVVKTGLKRAFGLFSWAEGGTDVLAQVHMGWDE